PTSRPYSISLSAYASNGPSARRTSIIDDVARGLAAVAMHGRYRRYSGLSCHDLALTVRAKGGASCGCFSNTTSSTPVPAAAATHYQARTLAAAPRPGPALTRWSSGWLT